MKPNYIGGASVSACRAYRYSLSRTSTNRAGLMLGFVMLNPSTANANQDDATIRRCLGFAERFGYAGIIVRNLYALRATDPKTLWLDPDPVGPVNDIYLATMYAECADIICAWGVNAKPERAAPVVKWLRESGAALWCLGVTKGSQPRHPLYVKNDQPLELYTGYL